MSLFSKRAAPVPLRNSGFSIGPNWTGETVTEETALEVSTVLACVSLLADSVAALPLIAIRNVGTRTERLSSPSWITDPAPTVTAYELMHMTVTSLALHGNAYWWMDWVGGEAGQPGQVVPLHPDNVTVTIVGNVRTYTVGAVAVPAENIMHLRWFTPPQAAKGISPIHQQRTTFGIALAQARHLAQFYGEGATPSSVLETDAELTPEAARVLQATWESQHRRHRKPAVLSGGLKWRPVQASAAEMELTASRIETVNEIARVFRIPPYMVGGSGPSNVYSNTEALGLQFVQYGLLPWLKRIEAAASSLMPAAARVEFDTSAFLRADTINRFRAHQIGIMSGILSPNEARQVENLEPYEGGNDFVMALPGAPMAGPGDTLPPVGIDNDPAQ